MKLEVIYTLSTGQELACFDFKPEIIETKEAFTKFCLDALSAKYSFVKKPLPEIFAPGVGETGGYEEPVVPEVYKLSGCIKTLGVEFNAEPEWWKSCNGKVYYAQEKLEPKEVPAVSVLYRIGENVLKRIMPIRELNTSHNHFFLAPEHIKNLVIKNYLAEQIEIIEIEETTMKDLETVIPVE